MTRDAGSTQARARRPGVARMAGVALVVVVGLVGCAPPGATDQDRPARPRDPATKVAVTPRALAAIAVNNLAMPSYATEATDLREYGAGSVGAELHFGKRTTLVVVVGPQVPDALAGCAGATGGCAELRGGTLHWVEGAEGRVRYVLAKAGATVVVEQSGFSLSGDPRETRLPIALGDVARIAHQRDADLETSLGMVEAGEALPLWREPKG